jgi:putative transposase
MVGPAAKREGVAHLQAVMGLSERRACSLVDADRKMIRYRPRRPPDTELRTQLRDLANARRRFGYRRACSSCCGRTANRPGSTGSTGSIAKRA